MKDLLLSSFESLKLENFRNAESFKIVGGHTPYEFVCTDADGSTWHEMGWYDGTGAWNVSGCRDGKGT
ncbi:MAG TPA: hypothetical protein VK169_01465 [Saprospiraceae bacterium]|nr:hypothetical protein [Saprospiraceae bacterium]